MEGNFKKGMLKRITILMVAIVFLFGIDAFRILYLQVARGDELSAKAESQQLSDTEVSAMRGTIYDSEGNVLAQSATVWNIFLDPSNIKDEETRTFVVDNLAKILGCNEEEKKEILTKPVTLGELTAFANNSETIRKRMDRSRTVKFSVGELLDVFGEENVKSFLQQKTAEAARKPEYGERFILINLLALAGFALLFALLATIALELIDKDKR
jgi:cell division protein FtsI/penicillin-binding protein 2